MNFFICVKLIQIDVKKWPFAKNKQNKKHESYEDVSF